MKPTLAERVLVTTSLSHRLDDYLQALQVWNWVLESLQPIKPNALLAVPTTNVERFVFDDNPVELVWDMVDAKKLKWETVFKTNRLPTRRMWFEHRFAKNGSTYGFLVVVDYNKTSVVFIGDTYDMAPLPIVALALPAPPWRPEAGCTIEWSGNAPQTHEACDITMEFLHACLFLLNVPRLCEIKPVLGGNAVSRNPVPHDYPAVEYKRVTITVGKTHPVYERVAHSTEPGKTIIRRRLHHVVGFFRHYTKHRAVPKIVWINEQWRGDPKVGVIIKEHHIKGDRDADRHA